MSDGSPGTLLLLAPEGEAGRQPARQLGPPRPGRPGAPGKPGGRPGMVGRQARRASAPGRAASSAPGGSCGMPPPRPNIDAILPSAPFLAPPIAFIMSAIWRCILRRRLICSGVGAGARRDAALARRLEDVGVAPLGRRHRVDDRALAPEHLVVDIGAGDLVLDLAHARQHAEHAATCRRSSPSGRAARADRRDRRRPSASWRRSWRPSRRRSSRPPARRARRCRPCRGCGWRRARDGNPRARRPSRRCRRA